MTDRMRRPLDDDALASALRDLATAIDWPGEASTAAGPDPATRVRVAIGSRRAEPGRRGVVASGPTRACPGAVALLALVGRRRRRDPRPARSADLLRGPGLDPPVATADRSTAGAAIRRTRSAEPPRRARECASRPPADLPPPRPRPSASRCACRATRHRTPRCDLAGPRARRRGGGGLGTERGPARDTRPERRPVLMTFDGTFDQWLLPEGHHGRDVVDPVTVDGQPGFWISGDPHIFFYRASDGQSIDDPRRWVGDALFWSDGTTTWRLETAAGREAAIRIAEGLR